MFFEIIIPVIMFDLLEADYSTKLILTFEEDSNSALDYDQMRNIGYETDNSFLNLGSLALLEVLYLI